MDGGIDKGLLALVFCLGCAIEYFIGFLNGNSPDYICGKSNAPIEWCKEEIIKKFVPRAATTKQ